MSLLLYHVVIIGVVTDASDTDVEKLFVRKDVRDILVRVTGFDLEKIFPVVPSSGKDQMKIELMTEEEVAKVGLVER